MKHLKLRDSRVKLTQMGVQGNQLTKLWEVQGILEMKEGLERMSEREIL